MKLRNKQTGEIGELHFEPDKEYHFTVVTEDPADIMIFMTLAELNEEWEDYEEPKEYWYISDFGFIFKHVINDESVKSTIEEMKSIGNYFETKEEAEKAVERLRAWKRLKDKGWKFTGWDRHPDYPGDFRITASDEWTCDDKDLDLLFGGEG